MKRVLAAGVGTLVMGCTSVDVLGTRTQSEDGRQDGTTVPNPDAERRRVLRSRARAQLNDAFTQLFFGDPETESVFRDQGDGTGYIEDIANGDVRTDAMGYGMLVTVQLEQQEVFDKLWNWTQQYMVSQDGPTAGLIRWQCDTTGATCLNSAATDASSIIATSLLMADARWGSDDTHDYEQEGLDLLKVMSTIEARNGGIVEGVANCFDVAAAFPRAGSTSAATETPVDYLMPAFYETWSRRDGDRANLWSRMAANARLLLGRVAHPATGLLPEMVSYDGTPVPGRDAYRTTTSRTLLNLALDHMWYGPHDWVVEQNERRLDFFGGEGVESYVSEYTTAGEPLVNFNTVAHRSLVALAAATSESRGYDVFIEELLDEPIPSGIYRYYDGMMYLLSLLVLSGQVVPG